MRSESRSKKTKSLRQSLVSVPEPLDDSKIYLTRDKHILDFFSPRRGRSVRFDLKRGCMLRMGKAGLWENVEHQHDFFRGFTVSDIVSEETFFKDMVKESKKVNFTCTSLSSFIARLKNVYVYENYMVQGVKFARERRGWGANRSIVHLEHPLEDYDKNVIKFFKDTGFCVTPTFESNFFSDTGFGVKIISSAACMDLSPEEKMKAINSLFSYEYRTFRELVDGFGYDPKSLIRYCTVYLENFENIQISQSIRLLRDYYQMANQMGRDVKKYPKYLKSMHDIISANYKSFKKDYNKILFANAMRPALEYKDKKFCVVVPKDPKDVVSEGTSLNHCVSSYVDKIIEGKTYITFLRRSNEPDRSLVTLELAGDEIVQAKGAYNRALSTDEASFLVRYAKKVGLKCRFGVANEEG